MSHALAFRYQRSRCRLRVVPYVRTRLVFAQAAVRTMEKKEFDRVLLDLPCFMNHGSWLDAPLESFPLVSSVLIKGEKETCSLFPLVPTDAACAAAWLAKKRSLVFECVGPLVLPDGSRRGIPSIQSLGNERLISGMSLKSYFEAAWQHLDSLGENTADSSIKNLIFFGEEVADRIRDTVTSGLEVLFVCEYRLWWAVSRALGTAGPHGRCESGKNGIPPTARSCARLLEDPYFMWSAGLFDDYLTINKKFQESLQSGSIASFDKYKTLAELTGRLWKKGNSRNRQKDAAQILRSMIRDLRDKTKSVGSGYGSPALFFENIRSRLGSEAEDEIARELLNYPMPAIVDAASNPPQYFEIAGDRILPGKSGFDLPDVFHANPYGEIQSSDTEARPGRAQGSGASFQLCTVHPAVTRQEAKELDKNPAGTRWALKKDYELHAHACRIAREAALRSKQAAPKNEELGVFTPVAFVFCSGFKTPTTCTVIRDDNLTQRQMNLGQIHSIGSGRMPPPDSVYSLLATRQGREVLFENHIERESITSLTLLFSGSEMGLERYAAIAQRPDRLQCRMRPQEDPELSAFGHSELGLVWAVKYAEKNAIAVAYPGWKPSPDVLKYAHKMQKRILTLPLDILPGEMAGRLQQLHFISNPLKLHPECERIVSRFVR